MASDNHMVSILIAAGLVLAAVYLFSALSSSGPTAATVAVPAMSNVLLAGLVMVLAATALWYKTFQQV